MRLPSFGILLASVALAAPPPAISTSTFDQAVKPLLSGTCAGCHNDKLSSGGLTVSAFLSPTSLSPKRDAWEQIARKVRSGEMPPKGIPVPPGQADAMVRYLDNEFARLDKATRPEPGRVIARRLNRSEYSNTIRDVLGVPFQADEEFPADDAAFGFDNIGDVLTVSPTLMQKYLAAGEQIAARAVGGDPLPRPGVIAKRDRIRRLEATTIQLKDRIDYDADYIVRVNLVGHRGPKDKAVNLQISVDGKPAKVFEVPVQISAVNQQGGATQRSSWETRMFLPAGDHLFRAEFLNDEEGKALPREARLNTNRNIYPDAFEIAGPYASAEQHPSQKKILICDPATGSACVNRILTSLSHRAYRRPVTATDLTPLLVTFDKAKAVGYTPAQSLQFAITAMLVSPNFLFRIEKDPKAGAVVSISDVELATRLSYFLWSSTPDDELLRVAESGKLHLPAVLDAQVKRMIADSRSASLADNFAGQWLEIRSLDAVKPDSKKFPVYDTDLKEAMRTETRMFFEAVLKDNRPVSDFLDGNYTFLNELLAKHYGIDSVLGPDFRRIELTPELAKGQRSGVLTHASVLTVSSYPSRTSVVLRGKYLLENVLGAPPPPPPPDVPRLNEDSVGVAKSLRQQMEQHRADAVCASCHSKMDVLGFGLENYDAIGRWRTTDGKFPVDSSGSFPNGKSFNGPAEMKTLLRDNLPDFTRTLAEKLLTYALGRGLESFDRRTVQDLVRQTMSQDYRMQSLVLGIVHSVPFQRRRADAKEVVKK